MNIRRYYYPGQIVFITQIVKDRKTVFDNPDMVELLKETLANVQKLHSYTMLAYVFLPDHFHLLIQPTGQSNFSQIMHSLKFNFTRTYKQKINCDSSLSFWQKRFWDHVIRDETDLKNHIQYIHYNPVKHGIVADIRTWQDSSYSIWEERGAYNHQGGWIEPEDMAWGE
jgi:putative transposase